jgi:SAM-dependent methyltransferase
MPDKATLMAYYQGFSFQKQSLNELLRVLPAIRRSLKYFIGAPVGTRRFLDYGGATGVYARAAQDLGWKAAVSDYDIDMLRIARDELGVPHTFVEPEHIDGEPYDVIFSFHVIEHWNEIDTGISRLLELLSPGGRLLFATPNALTAEKRVRLRHRRSYIQILEKHGVDRSAAERLLEQDDSITCWDPPRHLFAFTPNSMRAIGTRLGLSTRVMTGYNTSPLFEPRQYGIPTLSSLLRRAFNGLIHGRRSIVLASLRDLPCTARERLGLALLALKRPDFGEQLYVEFKKPN